jgi:GTP1/Obg family GTP-binding protein
MNQIHELWNDYKKLIPKGASDTQFKETRRAFYGGCSAIFALLVNDIAEMEESKAEKAMDSVMKELEDFAVQIKFGKA